MSYALNVSAEALQGLAAMEPELQERTLDELETLADQAQRLEARGDAPDIVRDFVLKRPGMTAYVFITIVRDEQLQTLQINHIGHYIRH